MCVLVCRSERESLLFKFFQNKEKENSNFLPTLDPKIFQFPSRNLENFDPTDNTLCVKQLSFFERVEIGKKSC